MAFIQCLNVCLCTVHVTELYPKRSWRPFCTQDSSAVQEQLKGVRLIKGSWSWGMCGAFCAVLADGSCVTWGYPQRGGDSSQVQQQLHQVQSVAGSDGAFAALRQDGTVVCWGDAMTGGDCSGVQEQLQDVREVCANGASVTGGSHMGGSLESKAIQSLPGVLGIVMGAVSVT